MSATGTGPRPCRVHETVTIGLHVANGAWQVDPDETDVPTLIGDFLECEQHGTGHDGARCQALRDVPPLPTLTQLADLIGEVLRQQGFAATQRVLDGVAP